jgi:hypothetical protein
MKQVSPDKTYPYNPMKKVGTLCLFLFVLSAISGQNTGDVLEKIARRLASTYQSLPLESVYIQTDKDVYAPGETVWFKGTVMDQSTRQLSTLSTDLYVEIFDNKGNPVSGDLFLLERGTTHGDLSLPEGIKRGRYYITAYTPLQYTPEQVYTRILYIDEPYRSDLLIDVLNKDTLFSGRGEAGIWIKLRSLDNLPEPRLRINYQVFLNHEEVESGRVRTDEKGIATLQFAFPGETGKKPLSIVFSDAKETWERTVLLKTLNDQITLDFHPEGGTLIRGIPQKIGFVSRDLWGNYLSVSGDILDSQGAVVAKCQSFTKGFGIIPVQLREEETYRFVITSDYGKGQVFHLPEGVADQPSLSIQSTDETHIHTYLAAPTGKAQKVYFTVTCGYTLLEAGELTISGPSKVNIPVESFPEGVVLLSLFDSHSTLLAERLVYIHKDKHLRFNVKASKKVSNIEVTLLTTGVNKEPVSAGLAVSSAPAMAFLGINEKMYEQLHFNSVLIRELPVLPYTDYGRTHQTAIDYILITNKLTDFSWTKVLADNSGETVGFNSKQLGEYISRKDGLYSGIDLSREPMLDLLNAHEDWILDGPKKKVTQARVLREPAYKSLLRSSTDLLEVIRSIRSFQLLNGQIIFPGMLNSLKSQMGATIVVDGQILGNTASVLDAFHPLEIEEINVYTDPVQIQKYTSFASGGLIEIFTKTGKPEEAFLPAEKNIQENNMYLEGYRIPRNFETEKMNPPEEGKIHTTLYWNPFLSTEEIHPVEFAFPVPGIPSKWILHMEGMDEQGRIGTYHSVIKN